MTNLDFEPQVERTWHTTRIVIMGLTALLLVGSGVVATVTFRSISSRATIERPSPTPLFVAVPSPRNDLTAPYVRIVAQRSTYGFKTDVPVDVYVHTNNKETVELQLTVSYEPDVLDVAKTDITSTDVYKVINVESIEDGRLTFSLFVNPQVGQSPVKLEHEAKVATIMFHTKTQTADVATLELEGVLAASSQGREKSANLLQSLEGVTFAVTP